ncbi:MAG: hypothetical protein ABSA34_03495 [Candidatus Goldiibacteriota bacterium]
MKRLFAAFKTLFIFIILIIIPAFIWSQDAGQNEDYIDGDTVQKHDTGDMLDSGLVNKVEKPTAVPTPFPTAVPTAPEATEPPTAVPTAVPTKRPTPKPTPRPVIKKIVQKKQRAPEPTLVPTPIPQAPKRAAEFSVIQATADELAKPRGLSNYFGIFDRDRKFRLMFTLQNTGEMPSLYTGATLKSGNSSIIISEPVKDMQTVLPADKREINFDILIMAAYSGDPKLPLTLNIKAAGFERDYPLDIYVEPENPYTLYYIGGIILLLIIILIMILTRRRSKTGKDDDFEIK